LIFQGFPVFWTGSEAAAVTSPGSALRALQGLRTLALGAATAAAVALSPAWARTPDQPGVGAPVALSALPPEARQTHRLILAGGPFPYSKDGTVFFNRERHLPPRPRGQYREYTVRTPGLSHRGARRIVCGGLPPTQPEVCYYTADHYNSFKRIEP
jgi:ribonuclease T1